MYPFFPESMTCQCLKLLAMQLNVDDKDAVFAAIRRGAIV